MKMYQPIIIYVDELIVIGISARICNKWEPNGECLIQDLWLKYHKEKILDLIPGKVDDRVTIGLYTDYENGVLGAFSMLIGSEIVGTHQVPEGMEVKVIPPAKYAIFTTPKGPISKIVPETWQTIWDWVNYTGVKRTFTGDFEWYDERSINPESAEIDIYVAIK